MGGLQAYQQAQQQQQQQQLYALKMAEYQRGIDEKKKREEALKRLSQDPRFAGLEVLLAVDPKAAIEHALPKKESPFGKVTPEKYTPESWAKFTETRNYADLVPTQDIGVAPSGEVYDKRTVRPGTYMQDPNKPFSLGPTGPVPNKPFQDYEIGKARAGASQTSVAIKQETEFGKKLGGELGDLYAGLLKADMNAPVAIGKYRQLGSLLGQVNTGKFRGTTVEIKAAAKSLGVNLDAIGIRDDVAPAQASRAISNQLALELRNPAGGAGMPGALSDKDREFLVQSIPGLENDPAAITKMIEYRVKLEERGQKVARMARDYRRKHGKFDEGFFDELRVWSDANPLFAGERGYSLDPKTRAYLDQYAPLGGK